MCRKNSIGFKIPLTYAVLFLFILFFYVINVNADILDNYYVFAWDNETANGGQVGKDGCPNDPSANLFDDVLTGQNGLISPCDTSQYINCGWNGAACTLSSVSLYIEFNETLTVPANSINITGGNNAPTKIILYKSFDNITYTYVGEDSTITQPSYILELPSFSAKYWKLIMFNSLPNGLSLYEFDLSGGSFSENSLPELDTSWYDYQYCYLDENSEIELPLQISDAESDTIYYQYWWDWDDFDTIVIDNFEDANYDMELNGWFFYQPGCNYTTENGFLQLETGCDEIEILKMFDLDSYYTDVDIDFIAGVTINATIEYCLDNFNDDNLLCLRLGKYNDESNNLYTNFSYWDGSQYVDFGLTYDYHFVDVRFSVIDEQGTICIKINGATSCAYSVTTDLFGTTDNTTAKFYMKSDFTTEQTSQAYNILDNLYYTPYSSSSWLTYTGSMTITHLFENTIETLHVRVSDYPNLPDYEQYDIPILMYGECNADISPYWSNETNQTDNTAGQTILEETRAWRSESFNDGEKIFNSIFYFGLFIGFIIAMIKTKDFEISLIIIGALGAFIAWLMSGNWVQIITSLSLLGFGITVLITKVF